MKYLSIELKHFKHLPLSNTDYFYMEMSDPVQIILGISGSGKTSLLKQLTVFPPLQSDFKKTGSKTLVVEHNKVIYTLKTVFTPSTKHSFIVDNQNLNEGGTLTVQKELIRQHFNIAPDIDALLHGEEIFTSMSFVRRKEWMVSLCDTDYTYAIKVFNKFREKQRDVAGALKMARKRLSAETDKILKTEEEQLLIERTSKLHELLSILLENRLPVQLDTSTLEIEIDRIQAKLKRACDVANTLINSKDAYADYSIDDLRDLATKIDRYLNINRAQLNESLSKLAANEAKVEVLRRAEKNTIDSLQRAIAADQLDIEAIRSTLLVSELQEPAICLHLFRSVKTTLIEIFTTIPKNIDKLYSSDNLRLYREKLVDQQNRKNKLTSHKAQLEAKLKHMLEHKDSSMIKCVNCSHTFSLIYSEQSHSDLLALSLKCETELEALNSSIASTEATIAQILDYATIHRQFTNIVLSNPQLSNYWQYIKDKNILIEDPKSGVHLVEIIDKDIDKHIQLDNKINKLNKDIALLQSLSLVGTESLQSLLESNKLIEAVVATLGKKASAQQNKIQYINKVIATRESIAKIQSSIEELLKSHDTKVSDYVETMRRQAYNACIRTLQSELGNNEHILRAASNQKAVIASIEQQISDLQTDEAALSLLIDTLSPADGLIAQGMVGFINAFVDEMNIFIEKVWSYPMVIQHCAVCADDGLEVDYRFPVRVGDDPDEDVGDVAKCSNGMKEMINLAYTFTAMKYKGLLDTPLYLDEFGSRMDMGHRSEVLSLIKAFVDDSTFSQIFIVSHDVMQYTALPSAQVCVLCSDNIITPEVFNEHVRFEELTPE